MFDFTKHVYSQICLILQNMYIVPNMFVYTLSLCISKSKYDLG